MLGVQVHLIGHTKNYTQVLIKVDPNEDLAGCSMEVSIAPGACIHAYTTCVF